MEKKLVSVIIPTFRATERLGRAIDSLLNQTYPFIEIIVVDDNDPDSEYRKFTERVIATFDLGNLLYIKHSHNKNGSAARNTGIMASHGEFITFLDDDDIFYPRRIERCVECLTSNPQYDVIYTDCDIFKGDILVSSHTAKHSGLIWKELLISQDVLGTGSNLLFRRKCLDYVSCFDERFLRFQDVEFAIRLSEKYRFFSLNEILVRKNVENTNVPPFDKLIENRELIFATFDYLINKLDPLEKHIFFEGMFSILYLAALEGRDKKAFEKTLEMQLKYDPSWKLRIKCLFPRLYFCYCARKHSKDILKDDNIV